MSRVPSGVVSKSTKFKLTSHQCSEIEVLKFFGVVHHCIQLIPSIIVTPTQNNNAPSIQYPGTVWTEIAILPKIARQQ